MARMNNDKLLVEGEKPLPLNRELSIVGKPINRLDGREKVTGQARYSGDYKLPDQLYGKILHCPHARARITKLDTTRAAALSGVKAILTKSNTTGWRTYWYRVSEPAFAEVLTHEGQEVAAVAAVDADTAQKAIELIDVEYEALPAMIDAEEALNSPPLALVGDEEYPGRELYDRIPSVLQRGDIEKGFAEADLVIEDTYFTPTQYHATVQTRACVAFWDGQRLTVWDAAQGVWNSKLAYAKSLDLDPDKVRVVVEYLGGGFGSKGWSHRIGYYAAKLSMLTEKPVRMEQTRAEEFLMHPHRYDCKIHLKIGARKDGKLTAIYERAVLNIGAVAGKANYSPNKIIWQTSNLYECDNTYLEQVGVLTNLQTTGPLRAPFNMPSIFCLETHIDRMADALSIDPLEFRLRNYKTHASTHIKPELMEREMKIPWSNKQLDKCMKKATESIGWKKREDVRKASNGSKKRGIGMASFIAHQAGGKFPNTAYADMDIHSDGQINLHIGIVDIGAGQRTVLAMIAAEQLGVKAKEIQVMYGDTEGTRYGPASHTSRITAEMGPAVLQAAAEARQKLFDLIAAPLGVAASELASNDGEICVRTDPDKSLSFLKACEFIDAQKPIHGRGSRKINPDSPLFSSFGAQAAEVEVDVETGHITIIRMTAAHDFGRAINPKLLTSQIIGGIEIGIGYALSEEGIYDRRTGKMLNSNLHQYKIPTSMDMPTIDAFIVESHDPYFAFDARGGAEVTNTPTPAAIGNAIHHAIGIWFKELPITPDKVLEAIRMKREDK